MAPFRNLQISGKCAARRRHLGRAVRAARRRFAQAAKLLVDQDEWSSAKTVHGPLNTYLCACEHAGVSVVD